MKNVITRIIDAYKQKQAIVKAEKIYNEIAESDKNIAEDFFSICAEPLSNQNLFRRCIS